MELPSAVKPGLWGATAGAIAMAIVGFSFLGWTSAATSQKLAQDTADSAVVAALLPFCVTKAEADPDLTILAKLQTEQSSYSRHDIVMKAGWATLGGETAGRDDLARACAARLHVVKAG
jgi:hypothetical protein